METGVLTEHSSSQFNNDVHALFNAVLKLGGLVESQFTLAYQAIKTSNLEQARRAILLDKKVNAEQAVIDELVTQLLALHNPAAFDLRMVLMAYRSAADLERIGDEVCKLAKFVTHTAKSSTEDSKKMWGFDDLGKLANMAESMLNTALEGFAHLDSEVLGGLSSSEDEMDLAYTAAINKVKRTLSSKNDLVDDVVELIILFRAMERVADHALNIGENVFYMTEGKTVRQVSEQKLKEMIDKKK